MNYYQILNVIEAGSVNNLLSVLEEYDGRENTEEWLRHAIYSRNREMIDFVLDRGVIPSMDSLVAAASIGDLDLYDYLRSLNPAIPLNNMRLYSSAGKYVDWYDDSREMGPLHAAALKGHLHVVRALVRRGAMINLEAGWLGDPFTPLRYAVFKGHVSVAQFLIEHGAVFDDQKLLRDAVGCLNFEMFKYAVSVVRSLEPGNNELSILMLCVEPDKYEYAKYLIEHGANVNHSTRALGSVLDMAICEVGRERSVGTQRVIKLLIESGADPDGVKPYNKELLEVE